MMIDQEPAFPVNFANDTEWDMEDPFGRNIPPNSKSQYTGITKRDYFAAKAMQAILSSDPDYYLKYNFIDVADFSYQCADVMIYRSENEQ